VKSSENLGNAASLLDSPKGGPYEEEPDFTSAMESCLSQGPAAMSWLCEKSSAWDVVRQSVMFAPLDVHSQVSGLRERED